MRRPPSLYFNPTGADFMAKAGLKTGRRNARIPENAPRQVSPSAPRKLHFVGEPTPLCDETSQRRPGKQLRNQ